ATLNIAVGIAGYTLTDRASWTNFGNKADMKILVEGDKRLFNPYGVMLVSPEKCPTVNKKAGQAFIDWLVSDAGQRAISAYQIKGKQVFFANANP
ncbi:MAG: substrate-binding domain-containing protein, partial [Pseudomonadota bacterium]|nr:substrate-binding domain-containing protein [Pseudomonadota bacterium]